MTIQQFAHKYNFKSSDRIIAFRLYDGLEYSEEYWNNKLKNEFVFVRNNEVDLEVVNLSPKIDLVEDIKEQVVETEESTSEEKESVPEGEDYYDKELSKMDKIAKIKKKKLNKN